MQLLKEKIKRMSSVAVKCLIVMYTLAVAAVGSADYFIPDSITVTQEQINSASVEINGISENITSLDAKLFGVVPIKKVQLDVVSENTLVPCGNVFGIKFFTKGVMVIKLSEIETKDGRISPAELAGIRVGDIIQSINGTEVNTVEEMADIIEKSKGANITVIYHRDGKETACIMTPLLSLSDRKYKTGIWVRDSTAGIGTMTYYNPNTGRFAGLGHGICDVDTGELMPLLRASVVDVEIVDIVKGRSGTPGELKGNFDTKKLGELYKNTPHGVYGKNLIDNYASDMQPLEIGTKDEVYEGEAEILCELDNDGIKRYSIKITKIKNDDRDGKNFVIEVTDSSLLSKTGGIVQGMSGSPIIQNGKLIGAVTHVLVNTPEKGYGIFIENMLKNESLN